MFFKGSRYENVSDLTYRDPAGRVISYKSIRYISPTAATTGYRLVQGDRLDLIAQNFYRDPERFWRICDANRATWPDDLLVPGATLGIPPSEG
jgi:nucleoid-associated protein YgaU